MKPADLKPESFIQYPHQGRAFAVVHVELLRLIPISLLPLILLQIQRRDVQFPAEQIQLADEVAALEHLDRLELVRITQPFAAIELPPELKTMDWVNHPQQFSERLTALLWQSHQIDAYHAAAGSYAQTLQRLVPEAKPAERRWAVALLGRGISDPGSSLFRKLAPHGTLFTNIDPSHGTGAIFDEAHKRAQRSPAPYGHWYIDGGETISSTLTTISYNRLVPAALKEFELLHNFSTARNRSELAAVEQVTSYAASLTPDQVGIFSPSGDTPLRQFEVDLLTKGAGCQIFSTTFVQWAARECLHRARPLTLIARFSTRQRMAPMEQLLSRDPLLQPQDPQGSLVDADMSAYYTWINLSRLPGGDESTFVAWWEDASLAVVVAPSMPKGSRSTTRTSLKELIEWIR